MAAGVSGSVVGFHYALVDDILTREDFDHKIEEKVASYGGAIDETAAALLVVEETGRSHQKISSITPSPSLVSLYGKVVHRTDPKEFTRDDGSPGCVARIELADETGTIPLVLWDEMAAGVPELEDGMVLEVIGRPKAGRQTEVHALAVRETAVAITLPEKRGHSSSSTAGIDARVLAIEPPRSFQRKDGGAGVVQEAIIGDPTGFARFITWDPALLEGIVEGSSIRITDAERRASDDGIEYLARDATGIEQIPGEIEICYTPPGQVLDKGTYTVCGRITTIHPVRPFTTRRGDSSWVRNLFIEGGLRIVIWGERACDPLLPGETIAVYNAKARLNRYGDVELSVGFGSAVRVIREECMERELVGVTVLSPEGLSFATADALSILEGAALPLAARFRLSGELSGSRFIVRSEELLPPDDMADLLERVSRLAPDSLSPSMVRD
ncbi:MAG: nucleotide-binding protein [Methanocalculus sp. MSAO_Arc1]|uniref:OB-fold nucleic acid binding domain-containing protein n=1 Tax=Methanocalculus TaxID=71151 RepID=UPI000FEEF909|nr:OB-fold nucleic acid binding domain-containing protein [Methanocalculus sp. MSAO_Arc1]MCP1662092.1 replication factor A1 [Methanocalculus sp. AMF5]RQD80151.1 MAG: nucleotide-binding protein [Methanocalculus sp. MSAO_Arc1]